MSERDDDSFGDLLRQVARAPAIDPRALAAGDLAGRKLAHFRVVARIGAGGMGVVYEAEDERLGRRVALKVLSAKYAGDDAGRALLVGEARAAAAVTHPSIAAIYEVGEADGLAFIAMELATGTTLRARIASDIVAPREAIAIAIAIAQGLARAHAAGIVHRDLKPDNILLGRDGQVKILDFGLARSRFASEGGTGRVQGTPAYMSPEQARGEEAGTRSDVYSFGATLYEILTGERAVVPGSVSPRARRLGVPHALDRIVVRCLEADPARRFADGASLVDALNAIAIRAQASSRRLRIVAIAVGLAATASIAVVFRRPAPPLAAQPLKRLTANIPEIPILDAALSPDGAALAYVDRTGLTLQRIGTPATRKIDLPDGATPELVTWFPRGDALLVSSTIRGAAAKALWRVKVDGGEATRITEGGCSGMRVSPDGTRIAVAEIDRVSWLDLTRGAARTEVARKDQGCSISEVAWSPDGARIAYATLCFDTLAATSIESVGLAGGVPATVIADPRLFNDSARGGLVWTRAGEVVFPLAEWLPAEAGSNLFAVAVDPKSGLPHGAPRAVTSWVGVAASALSANAAGDRIAFVRFELQADVFVGDLEDGGRRLTTPRRLTLTDRNERPSAWSRDGRGVYFFSDRNGNFDLFFQSLDGSAARTIVADDAWETLPQVSPDGADLLYWRFAAVRAGEAVRPDVFRVAIDGGTPERLLTARTASHPAGAGRPQPWETRMRCPRAAQMPCVLSERDGDALVFVDLDPKRGRGAEILRIPHATAASNIWDVSPDGARLAIPTANGPIRIHARSGEEIDVAIAPGCDPLVPAWSADGEGLFVSTECASDPPFRLYHRAIRGELSLLWQDPPNYILESEASPDGAHLAIAVKHTDNDVWMLELR